MSKDMKNYQQLYNRSQKAIFLIDPSIDGRTKSDLNKSFSDLNRYSFV
jgi:hypothetical protein